jgi:hypothetical protein
MTIHQRIDTVEYPGRENLSFKKYLAKGLWNLLFLRIAWAY